jgi:hypothetical protein
VAAILVEQPVTSSTIVPLSDSPAEPFLEPMLPNSQQLTALASAYWSALDAKPNSQTGPDGEAEDMTIPLVESEDEFTPTAPQLVSALADFTLGSSEEAEECGDEAFALLGEESDLPWLVLG